jgi:ABC-type transporter Mla subunit MlaD
MKNRNAFLAGLFIICCVILTIGVVIGVRGLSMEKRVVRIASFRLADNISGLREGDDVRIGGHRVGVVKKVRLEDGSDDKKVLVSFTIPASADIRKDAHIAIESSVTGVANLNIDDFGKGASLGENDQLVGAPSPLVAILDAAKRLAPNLDGAVTDVRQQTLPRVNETIDKVKGHVDPTATKFQAVADRGSEALVNIRDVFGDTKTDFRTTMSNLAASTTSIREKIGGILEKVDSAMTKIGTSLDATQTALEDIKKSAEHVRDLTGAARNTLVTNRSKIDAMIASLKTTGDNLKFATAEIRRSPWRLLYKPGAGEVANLNLYDTARQFAEGANDLNDAASALRDSLKNPDVKEEQVKSLLEKLDATFQKFNQVESELWKEVRE